MSAWFDGLKWAESEYQKGASYSDIQSKIDYTFEHNDFDRGASDYLNHIWCNPSIFGDID